MFSTAGAEGRAFPRVETARRAARRDRRWRAGLRAAATASLVGVLGIAAAVSAACRGKPSTGAGSSRPDIVLISIDTLRADHLGSYGYPDSPYQTTGHNRPLRVFHSR